jgi:hypothetical protein
VSDPALREGELAKMSKLLRYIVVADVYETPNLAAESMLHRHLLPAAITFGWHA